MRNHLDIFDHDLARIAAAVRLPTAATACCGLSAGTSGGVLQRNFECGGRAMLCVGSDPSKPGQGEIERDLPLRSPHSEPILRLSNVGPIAVGRKRAPLNVEVAQQPSKPQPYGGATNVETRKHPPSILDTEAMRLIGHCLTCRFARNELFESESSPVFHQANTSRRPSDDGFELSRKKGKNDPLLTSSLFHFTLLSSRRLFPSLSLTSLRELVGLISEIRNRDSAEESNFRSTHCHTNSPSVPPHLTSTPKRPALNYAVQHAHSLIPLWTRPHSAMARCPEACCA